MTWSSPDPAPDERRWRIGELAELTGVSRRSLRYYEEHGLIAARRMANDYRTYDAATAHTVRKIKSLLAAGLSLQTVRNVLPCTLDATPRVEPCADLIATLRREVERLDGEIAAIATSRDEIAAILDRSGVPPDGVHTPT